MTPKIAVFCSGNGSNFEAILGAIRSRVLKAEVAAMVCDNPEAYAVRRAGRHGVPVIVLSPRLFPSGRSYEGFIVRILKSQGVEWIALAGFMRLLTPYFIRVFRGRILNVHPSLLPAFKGAHAIRDAFKARVPETGVTVHVVTEKLDSGPILAQKKVSVLKSDTLKKLEHKIHLVEYRLYPAAIQEFINVSLRAPKGRSNLC